MSEHSAQPEQQLTPHEVLEIGKDLIEHFGVQADPIDAPEAFQKALKELNPRYKNDRTLVRWELEADQTQWPQETVDIIEETATRMRMLEAETPLTGDFDVVISIGAARQAPKDRLLYAGEAFSKKEATGILVGAGSLRPLNEAEQEAVGNYAPGAVSEIDLIRAAAKVTEDTYPETPVRVIEVSEEKAHNELMVATVLAELQAEGSLPENVRIAVVTTQIYQAATQLDAQRAAKRFNAGTVFTAGNPSDPSVAAKRTVATYLSEINKTLAAASKTATA